MPDPAIRMKRQLVARLEITGLPAADDRLPLAANAAGLPVHVLQNPKVVPGNAIPDQPSAIALGASCMTRCHAHQCAAIDELT